jgi:hypothetical protein
VVLYKRFPDSWRWAILSSIGWITGYLLFVVFLSAKLGFLLGPVLGGAVGLAQWFLLRKEVDWSGWWIVISVLAWTTGLTLVPGFLSSGALPGALTGFALGILLLFPKSQSKWRSTGNYQAGGTED